jgi:2-polyprenyl-6-methoxyphenol hydroxylase-like FAD-dependent oxidoreductase
MRTLDTQVLIVGAGPAGLTLAGELQRLGVSCRIIDRATEPSLQSRALVLHCATQRLLQGARLRDRVAEMAIPIRGMRLSYGQRPLASVPFDLGPYPALSLPQQETEAILRSALSERGVKVEWRTELTQLRQSVDSVVAGVGDGTITAAYVVGCDGAHSTVRHLIGAAFEGSSLPETLWMADAAVDWDFAPDHVWQFLESQGALSAIPMPGGLWRLVTLTQERDGVPTAGFFEAAVARCARVPAPKLDVSTMSAFRVNCRLADKYGEGRVLIAGDAAHIHSPIGGQGMNVGMQDAFSLARSFSTDQWPEPLELLATYQSERRPVAARVIRANAKISKLAMSTRTIPRFVRDRVLPTLLSLPPLARRAGLEASGLT